MKKKILCWVMILVVINTSLVYANAGEPPSIIINTSDAPDDCMIYVVTENGDVAFEKYKTFGEYTFKQFDIYMPRTLSRTLKVTSQDKTFTLLLEDDLENYNNIYHLSFKNERITKGKGLVRSIILVASRIFLTLVIEGIVFYMFAFRDKRSWLVFLLINLGTQGLLNILLNSVPTYTYYLFIGLCFYEIFILLFEVGFFSYYIKEHSKTRVVIYVIAANLTSLYLGIKLLPYLPI